MKTTLRLNLVILWTALFPLLTFVFCTRLTGLNTAYSLFVAVVSSAAVVFFSTSVITSGLIRPMVKVSESVKQFIKADFRLEAAIPKQGWPEAAGLTSALNRLMLELSAYRAFQFNQVLEERSKANALIETITDGLLLVDDRGGLIYSNSTALQLLGIDKHAPGIVLPGSVKKENFSAPIAKIMASDKKYLTEDVTEAVGVENFDAVRVFRFISNHFPLATMKHPGRVIMIRDITNEKEIEKAKESFFHMITHDMRTPLTSILGFSHLLVALTADDPKAAKYLQFIVNASNRLNGMISDILNSIKLERGTMELHIETFDVSALCAQLIDSLSPQSATKQIALSLALPEAKIQFPGDAALIERVICNLLGNALKFTPCRGSIKLSVVETPAELRFEIADTGPGVPESERSNIFEKFVQCEAHKSMGFGLGLAMCKMAVELHGGRIWVESEEGKGSRFIFTLPRKSGKAL
ncbi:MAG TPA: PAS domain-containing sensor histidine kinase [Elusimicrobiales bacterium]|nr:PAS domain-containing sensor histidine kinase [Elusimicrobiales bacterium]